MALFEKFKLAFERREQGTWVVPSLLPAEAPADWHVDMAALSHARCYHCKILPLGVFGKVLTRLVEFFLKQELLGSL